MVILRYVLRGKSETMAALCMISRCGYAALRNPSRGRAGSLSLVLQIGSLHCSLCRDHARNFSFAHESKPSKRVSQCYHFVIYRKRSRYRMIYLSGCSSRNHNPFHFQPKQDLYRAGLPFICYVRVRYEERGMCQTRAKRIVEEVKTKVESKLSTG